MMFARCWSALKNKLRTRKVTFYLIKAEATYKSC